MENSLIIKNKNNQKLKLTVVCGVHGDELFGKRVFEYFKKHLNLYEIDTLILANQKALLVKKRFIEQDLNRSFPGMLSGNLEEEIAAKLVPILKESDFVIDIHTTVSDITLVPIVTSMNKKTTTLINLLPCKNIAYVQKPLSNKSLIGQVDCGISLEFNKTFAKRNEAIKSIADFINNLTMSKKFHPKKRNIFYIDGSISKRLSVPKNTKNFHLIKKYNVYPFLFHKNSYPDIHAMSASKKEALIC